MEAKLIVTNNSGSVFTFNYKTDEEAETLFNSHIYKSGQSVEFWPASGAWFYVWNRNLDKTFQCWKN
jgi:hypothetical protein